MHTLPQASGPISSSFKFAKVADFLSESMPNPYLEGAAAFLGGISKWTVHAWLAKGKLRGTKVGARTMIRECDLQAFLASCNPEPAGSGKRGRAGQGKRRSMAGG